MVDVSRDPRWGRVVEGAGESTWLGSKIAAARVKGLQGDKLSANDSVAACVKHFAGNGATEAGRDYTASDLSERAMRETQLPPFQAAVDAGARCFMSAFNAVDGVPGVANDRLLRDLLRDEWGFRGIVVSDFGAIKELTVHGVAENDAEAARMAFRAGTDIDMESRSYVAALPGMVREGLGACRASSMPPCAACFSSSRISGFSTTPMAAATRPARALSWAAWTIWSPHAKWPRSRSFCSRTRLERCPSPPPSSGSRSSARWPTPGRKRSARGPPTESRTTR